MLTRAEETLREKGPTALSLRELARELGVSHAAPSRHFKDKQALLDALALLGFHRLETAMATPTSTDEPFAERIAMVVRVYVDFAVGNPELLDLMFSVKHQPEASEALLAASTSWFATPERVIIEGQRRGEVRPGPVAQFALPLFTTIHGFASLAASEMLPGRTKRSLDDVIAYIVRGCVPDPVTG